MYPSTQTRRPTFFRSAPTKIKIINIEQKNMDTDENTFV